MLRSTATTGSSIAVGVGIFLLLILCLLTFRDLRLKAEADEVADTLLNRLESISTDAIRALTALNEAGYEGCTDATLLAMRQQLFQSPYIIDIGYIEGNLVQCTTGTGVLDEPVDNGPATYIGAEGGEVRIRPHLKLLMFDDRYMSAVLLRRGHFNAVLDPSRLNIPGTPYLQWEIVSFDDNGMHTMGGTKGIFEDVTPAEPLLFGNYFSRCSRVVENHCVAVTINHTLEFAHRRMEVAIVLSLSLALAMAAGTLYHNGVTRRRSVGHRVRRGFKRGSFYWLYQPIVDMNTGAVLGCEALARFRDSFGTLTPDKFIPSLREQEITWPFTELMIKRILEELEPIAAFPPGFRVSVNLFPFDIERGHIAKLPNLPGLSESRFKFSLEVTEDEYLDSPSAHQYLEHIAQQGYGIAIDDFGTGYSNLKTLTLLHFDYLKVDRSFVKDIETKGLKISVIPQVVDIARKFGLRVIAEGIETEGQHKILQALGIQYGQGWLYGKPMPPEALANLVALHDQAG